MNGGVFFSPFNTVLINLSQLWISIVLIFKMKETSFFLFDFFRYKVFFVLFLMNFSVLKTHSVEDNNFLVLLSLVFYSFLCCLFYYSLLWSIFGFRWDKLLILIITDLFLCHIYKKYYKHKDIYLFYIQTINLLDCAALT